MSKLDSILRLEKIQALFSPYPKLRLVILMVALALIPAWQYSIYSERDQLVPDYINLASIGSHHQRQFPFYYFFGLYPVVAAERDAPPADKFLEYFSDSKHPMAVEDQMERLGALLFFPDTWLGGDPTKPSQVPANSIAFVLALMALFASFWAVRLELPGLIIVAFIGSNPYQLWETYRVNNIFGWFIILTMLLLAACLPLIFKSRGERRYNWYAVAFCGALFGTLMHLRSEYTPLVISVIGVIIFMAERSWRQKAALLLAFAISWAAVGGAWSLFFEYKFWRANKYVAEHNGFLRGKDRSFHEVWFVIWTGLGDFDEKYGFLFDDRAAHAFSLPIARHTGQPRDSILMWDVINHIKNDPSWYMGILYKRLQVVLLRNTPPSLAWGQYSSMWPGLLPWLAVCGLLLAGLLLWRRAWPTLKLLLFPTTAAALAIFVFSANGLAYYSVFHLVLLGLLLSLALETVLQAKKSPN